MSAKNFVGLLALLLIVFGMSIQVDAYSKPQRFEKAFNPGARFGRSYAGSKKVSATRTMVAPRNERFELGSRYGKRSEMGEITEPIIYSIESRGLATKQFQCGKADEIMCRYTGISNIYRCNQSFDDEAKDDLQRNLVE